jgi:hypothetical protein
MRTRSTVALVFALVVGASVLPRAAAAQQHPSPSPPPAFAQTKPLQPFGNLFCRVRPGKPQTTPLFAPPSRDASKNDLGARPSRTIVCGMKLVPADPAFDATIRRTVPENSPAFMMRTVPPPVCRQ